jgi:hypothetical protein
MKLVLETTVDSISSRVDNTVKIVISTQELDPSQAASLFAFRGKYVKVLFSDNNISPMEEKLIDEEVIQDGRKIKSSSQRLRSVFYKLWEAGGSAGDFDSFYKSEMNRVIDHFKAKLN